MENLSERKAALEDEILKLVQLYEKAYEYQVAVQMVFVNRTDTCMSGRAIGLTKSVECTIMVL